MAYNTRNLPLLTRTHLHSLVTNPVYRHNAICETYDYAPQGDGKIGRPKVVGETVKKYGYNANLPAGLASRGNGLDPGAYRLVAYTATVAGGASGIRVQRTTWWVGEHVPGNMYKYHKINIPACRTCGGTADHICQVCGGTGRTPESMTVFAGACVTCNKEGFSECAACRPVVVIDGKAISRTLADWE
jgi:hypothetical protein